MSNMKEVVPVINAKGAKHKAVAAAAYDELRNFFVGINVYNLWLK